jgi:hypothetical protein
MTVTHPAASIRRQAMAYALERIRKHWNRQAVRRGSLRGLRHRGDTRTSTLGTEIWNLWLNHATMSELRSQAFSDWQERLRKRSQPTYCVYRHTNDDSKPWYQIGGGREKFRGGGNLRLTHTSLSSTQANHVMYISSPQAEHMLMVHMSSP